MDSTATPPPRTQVEWRVPSGPLPSHNDQLRSPRHRATALLAPVSAPMKTRTKLLATSMALLAVAAIPIGMAYDRANSADIVTNVTSIRSSQPLAAEALPAVPAQTPEPTAAPTPTTAPMRYALIGGDQFSAVPAPLSTQPQPVALGIDRLKLAGAPVVPVAVTASGAFDVPSTANEIGWYSIGPRPGDPGSTVLAAHVGWKGKAGAFARLGTMELGDVIEVGGDNGTIKRYRVTERLQVDKQTLPFDRIWRYDGAEELVLITCGGAFNPSVQSYADNIIVFASPDA
jgi:LPXTG-site transpeptidase (sortase) family protein